MSNSGRYSHVGKGPEERAAYSDFLRSRTPLDKTVKDRDSFSQSDESPVEINKITSESVSKKSFSLKIKDFFSNNMAVSLVILVLGGVGSLLISIHTDTKVLETEVVGINEDIDEIKEGSRDTEKTLRSIEIFIKGLSKDLEFLSSKKIE